VADIRNSAAPLEGILKSASMAAAGSIAGGMFLKQFVGSSPWAHLDIAGVSWSTREGPYSPRGATGTGVRLLIQFLRDWAASPKRPKPSQ
jgi:leucyl aminopeptidase